MPGLILTEHFWDCECNEPYEFIHTKNDMDSAPMACPKCGAVETDQPDSRFNEVADMLVYRIEEISGLFEALSKTDLPKELELHLQSRIARVQSSLDQAKDHACEVRDLAEATDETVAGLAEVAP